MKRRFVLVLLSYLLAACGAEPTPDLLATHLAVEKSPVPTLTLVAPTPTNTSNPTRAPKLTPLPTWTRRPLPTSTTLPAIQQQTPVADSGRDDSDLSQVELVIQRLGETPPELLLIALTAFLLGLILLRAWFLHRTRRAELTVQEVESNYTAQMDELRNEHQREIAHLKQAHEGQIEQLEKERQADMQRLKTEAFALYERQRLEAWFQTLRQSPWSEHAAEVEIETKFVFQLLQFLGCPEHEIEMRTPIPVQYGTSETTVKADFVVRSSDHGALLVVEAKSPDYPLTDTARRQACSYAFHLSAPLYMVTNGHELQIYLRGVTEDQRLLSCNTSQLKKHWKSVAETASRSSVVALRNRLDQQQGKRTRG